MSSSLQSLNQVFLENAPAVWDLFSEFGKKICFIEDGVLGQTAQARVKASRFNATLGEAGIGGKPLHLPSMHKKLNRFAPADLYPYASPFGDPMLRKVWREKILTQCPSLTADSISTPVAVGGLTHGLSLAAELFVNPGDPVLLPAMHWENYETIFGLKCGGDLVKYPLFDESGAFSTQGLRASLDAVQGEKAFVILNFPSNPCGYMPTLPEAQEIMTILLESAERKNLVVLVDDAYFGFFYTDDCCRESLFALLAGSSPNILPLRLDGATKELFAGGLRTGFLTAGAQSPQVNTALEKKIAGAVRCTISSCSHPSQTILLQTLLSEEYPAERAEYEEIMLQKGKKVLELAGQYSDMWQPYPFNAGYFVCIALKSVDAYRLREHLLDAYQTGVIVLSDRDIRISFPCIDTEDMQELFDTLYKAASDLAH